MRKKFCLAGFILIFIFIETAYSLNIPDDMAVRIIVSEAANQGLKGMICVGEVIRRRKSIKGFVGYRSKRVNSQPKAIWRMARKAWKISAHTNHTNGADHFANIRDGNPWWVKHCVKTYQYKDHVFYRVKRQRKN